MIGPISDTANSAVVLRRDTLEVTGLSYPIGSARIGPESTAISESEEPLAGSRSGPSDTTQRVRVLASQRGDRHPRKTAKKLPLNCEGRFFTDLGMMSPS